MQFPESWLRTFCNPPLTTNELAETLTMAGLEVEEMRPVAPAFSSVVVGEIKHVDAHPAADRLRICKVDVAQSELLTIVCGASNARAGIKVPCAIVGAKLPAGADGKPFLIKVGKLRGVESYGMLCSGKELGLPDDTEGLLELASDAPNGLDIRNYLQLDDVLFTLKLTPNLAHCLSVYGVARELSALTGASLSVPTIPPLVPTNSHVVPLRVTASDLCGRFSGRTVYGVKPSQAKTPQWMVNRLLGCGQRSISPLVDISNYVMFEWGQPSHIFDLDKIRGDLDIRWGASDENLELLNGTTVQVDGQVGVIADEQGVESLAGIMGGLRTSVTQDTTNIYIEAAFWWPQAIVGRSRRFRFSTDAGHRFERGVDPAKTVEILERITQLVVEICGDSNTTWGPVDDHQSQVFPVQKVSMRVQRAAKIIGMPLTAQQCLSALKSLGLDCEFSQEIITVIVPSYRFDIRIEEDLIEEVARVIGYNQLPTTPPLAPITPRLTAEERISPFAARRRMADLGYQETINFSFVQEGWELTLAGNAQPIKLINPIASHLSVMRSSLLGSLLQVLKFNLDRKVDRIKIFELGRVFLKDESIPASDSTVKGYDQPMRISGVAYGAANPLQWGVKDSTVDFFDVKGDVQALLNLRAPEFLPAQHPAMHPGRCAQVYINGQSVGFIGELHPQWRQEWGFPFAPVMFELSLDAVLSRKLPQPHPVSKFQPVERDIAVVVAESVTYQQIMQTIHGSPHNGDLLQAQLFDLYRPKQLRADDVVTNGVITLGEKSLAVRLKLGRNTSALTESEIDSVVKTIVDSLADQLDAKLRTS